MFQESTLWTNQPDIARTSFTRVPVDSVPDFRPLATDMAEGAAVLSWRNYEETE